MKHKQITVEQLSDLAQEAEDMDPIDWQEFNTTKEFVYRLMASAVIEQIEEQTEDTQMIIAMASLTKLLVENFVLNARLHSK
jgi:uncharacterized protein YgbK (DUF1537 family)